MKTCQRCFYFRNLDKNEAGLGECHRYAPKPVTSAIDRTHRYRVVWPTVGIGDWCGQYQRAIN